MRAAAVADVSKRHSLLMMVPLASMSAGYQQGRKHALFDRRLKRGECSTAAFIATSHKHGGI
jgi:hypothetical protein